MALKIRVKSQFKKDLKKAIRDPEKDTDLLQEIIQTFLVNSKKVPERHKPQVILPFIKQSINRGFVSV